MDSQAIQAQMAQLSASLHAHNHAYYVLNQPLISDYEFDTLLKELETLELTHPNLADPNSPTKRVGGDLTKKFETKKHRFPMLSLSNSYSEQDIIDWAERCQKTLQEASEFVCELKYDGVAIGIQYQNGKLIRVSPWPDRPLRSGYRPSPPVHRNETRGGRAPAPRRWSLQ